MHFVEKVFHNYPFYKHSLDCFQYCFVIYVGIIEKVTVIKSVTNFWYWRLGNTMIVQLARITSSVQKYLQNKSDHAINHWAI